MYAPIDTDIEFNCINFVLYFYKANKKSPPSSVASDYDTADFPVNRDMPSSFNHLDKHYSLS